MASFNTGWREQHGRMLRSLQRLQRVAVGVAPGGTDQARDALFHFFQDSWHLVDWIRYDEPALAATGLSRSQVRKSVLQVRELQIAADIANATKHLADTKSKLVRQHATVCLRPSTTPAHAWNVAVDGTEVDAVALAGDVVAAWDVWLRNHSLQ